VAALGVRVYLGATTSAERVELTEAR
jgi:hypothetical protein